MLVRRVAIVGLLLRKRSARVANLADVGQNVALREDAVLARALDHVRILDSGEGEDAEDGGKKGLRVLRVGVDGGGLG